MTALHADSAARLVDTIVAELEGQKLGQLLLLNMAPDGPLHPLSSVWLSKLSELRGVFEPGGSVAIVRNTKPLVGAAGLSGMGGMGGFGGGSSVGAPPSFQTLEL